MTDASGGNSRTGVAGARATQARQGPTDALRALLRLADGRMPDASLLRDALRCAAAEFGACFALLKAAHRGSAIDDYAHSGPLDPSFWREPASRTLAQSIATGQSFVQRFRARGHDLSIAVIAAPIRDDAPEALGGLALVIEVRDDAQLERSRVELRAFATMLAMLMRPRPVVREPAAAAHEVRAAAIAACANSRDTVAIAMVNQLRAKLGCEQVAIGAVHRNRVQLLAVSGFADVAARTPGAQAIIGAMEECLDLGRIATGCASQSEGEACALHRHWSSQAEGAFVATIPLSVTPKDPIEVLLALRHVPGRQFGAEELRKIAESVAPYAAGLRMATLAGRSLVAHAADSVRGSARAFRTRRGLVRAVLLGALAVGIGWIALGRVEHRISAEASLVPTVVREMTAPFEGAIIASSVFEGSEVKAGDVLFTLDTTALETERRRLLAAIAASDIEAEQARAAGDQGQARLLIARGDIDRVMLAAVERRIREAVVRAPEDGVILRGDLRGRLGSTASVGESLLEFAPLDSIRVLVRVPERDVLMVSEGASAEFRPQARPDMVLPMEIVRIRPAAEVADSQNVFVAEGRIDSLEPWMRSGIEGAVRINAGERPVWWSLFHRLIDAVRIRLWV